MLDLLGIVSSGVMMMIVVIRAVQLDLTQEWFQRLRQPRDDADGSATGTAPARGHRRWHGRS